MIIRRSLPLLLVHSEGGLRPPSETSPQDRLRRQSRRSKRAFSDALAVARQAYAGRARNLAHGQHALGMLRTGAARERSMAKSVGPALVPRPHHAPDPDRRPRGPVAQDQVGADP